MIYPDKIQPKEQLTQASVNSDNLNEKIPSPTDLDETIEAQTIDTEQQVTESYEPNITQPIEIEDVLLVENNSMTIENNSTHKKTTPLPPQSL